ncbi:MAG: LamG domain-containing protein, partial [Minisyncoccia bacterium]
GNYYTYTPGGSWELTTLMESSKQKMGGGSDKTSTDGGSYPELYEVGTNLTLLPVDYGDPSLVGYWKFDEGTGGTAYDASGHNATGTWSGTGGHWTASSKTGAYAAIFNGSDDQVVINVSSPTEFTKMAWIKPDASQACSGGVLCDIIGPYFHIRRDQLNLQLYSDSLVPPGWHSTDNGTITSNQWQHVAATYSNGTLRLYINGVIGKEVSATRTSSFPNYDIGADGPSSRTFYGSIDNVRIYNRALSAAEIQAIYNAGN